MAAAQRSRQRQCALVLAAGAMLLVLGARGAEALKCYATVLTTRGELQVVKSYQCDEAAAACGAYTRPCSNSTTTGCTTAQVLAGQSATIYTCFHSLSACQAVAQLQNFTLDQCCSSNNCNAPEGSASLAKASISLLAAAVAAALLLVLAA